MAYRRRSSVRGSARRGGSQRASYGGRSRARGRTAGVRQSAGRIRIELVHTTAPSLSRPAELIGVKPAEPPATSRF